MNDIQGKKNIEKLRRRLYERSNKGQTNPRHDLTDKKVEVSRQWNDGNNTGPDNKTSNQELPKKRYRLYILLGSLSIFAIVALATGAFLLFEGNQISSENIQLSIEGPNSIDGGEEMNVQIAVTNENDVAIDSTVLVIKYPAGARSADEEGNELFEQRISLDRINAGESRNVPIQMVAYGEEGDQLDLEAFIEYRIEGSDSVFRKEAEPLLFEIINSPIVVSIDSVKNVSSGQEVEVVINIQSNSQITLSDLLVSTSYPSGFQFASASPSPDLNKNVWFIDELEPEETETITIRGNIKGFAQESATLNVTVGPSQPDNQFLLDATLAKASKEFFIENPFIDVDVAIEDDYDGSVVLEPNQEADIDVTLTNTLNESVYDLMVEVVPNGLALKPGSISVRDGFYDSNRGIVRFDVTNNSDFEQITPNSTRSAELSISPSSLGSAASFTITVNVYARRVSDNNAQEQLIGTSKVEAKYASTGDLGGQAAYMSGPIPPKVGETTRYLVSLVVTAGANNLTGATVKTSLPSYVTWVGEHTSGSEVEFNEVDNSLTWEAGSIGNGQRAKLDFAVELLPSSSQAGITPVLVNQQELSAVDGFTGVSITDTAPRITTELSAEAGHEEGNGRVRN